MCEHYGAVEAGFEQVTFWQNDLFCCEDIQLVHCPDCDSTFLLDDLHDLE